MRVRFTEEEVDGAADRLRVHQIGDLAQLAGVLDAHALLDGAAKLQEALSHFLDGQLVKRTQTTVAQMVDVVDVGLVALCSEIEHVSDDGQEVLRTDVHDILGDVHVELAVDAESSDLAQSIAVLVEELLLEEGLGLVDLRRIAGTKSSIDAKQGGLVLSGVGIEIEPFHGKGVQDERIARILDNAEFLDRGGLDGIDGIPDGGSDAADLLALLIDDLFGRIMLWSEVLDLDVDHVVEEFEDLLRGTEGLLECSHEDGRGDLRGLVDLHRQDILLGHLEFDPGASPG